MNKTFTKLKCTALAAAALTAFCAFPAAAQLNYRATSATNTVTTYTDLGTTGTAITTTSNDDADSAPQNIGFTFDFNGLPFTQFVLNTNGYIKLGSTASSSPTMYANLWGTGTDANVIAVASGVDLQGAANQTTSPTEYRVATTGTAPNRVTTIQWENVADKASGTIPAQFTTMQFQIKLYETTNNIEFVYGAWTANTATPTGQPFLVGLRGTTVGDADRLFASKASSASAWSTTIFDTKVIQGGVTYLASHFVRNTFLPDAGRTYRFAPTVIPANDLMVEDIFTQGKISVAGGAPHQVKALVKNVGSATATNKVVTLTISGANAGSSTATIATLAPGATTEVSFTAYTPTTVGQNFLEVTLPADDVLTNNTADETQYVTADQESYALYTSPTTDPTLQTATTAPFGQTAATNSGARLSKFFATNRVRINSVRTYIPNAAGFTQPLNTVGRTVKAIVVDAAGNVIGESADMVLTASDVDQFINIPLTTMAVVENEVYYVGLHLAVSPTATASAYPFAAQNQISDRTGATYAMPTPGTTPVAPTATVTKLLLLIEAQLTNITGVKEELNAKLVSVYPNPSNGVFKISANDMKGTNLNLEVRDLQGKLVYSATAAKEGASINLKNVASGIYMLQVSTDSEVAVKRLVIQ